MTGWILALIALALAVLGYTVTITLYYSNVVRDTAVIRTVIEERTSAYREELARLREELTRSREEISALRVTVEQFRAELRVQP